MPEKIIELKLRLPLLEADTIVDDIEPDLKTLIRKHMHREVHFVGIKSVDSLFPSENESDLDFSEWSTKDLTEIHKTLKTIPKLSDIFSRFINCFTDEINKRICYKCKYELVPGTKFCPNCGEERK